MNQKIVKVLSMLFIIVTLCSVCVNVFAADAKSATITPKSITADTSVGSQGIDVVGQKIVAVLQTVGVVLSVVVLIILGIKYMMGSAEEKADYKKSMIPYIVGAALIFAASAFAQVIYGFFSGWQVG